MIAPNIYKGNHTRMCNYKTDVRLGILILDVQFSLFLTLVWSLFLIKILRVKLISWQFFIEFGNKLIE